MFAAKQASDGSIVDQQETRLFERIRPVPHIPDHWLDVGVVRLSLCHERA